MIYGYLIYIIGDPTQRKMTSNNDYDYGYIYCISNVSMPNIVNIGITWMTPEQKIADINGLPILWRPPTPYKCEFAKRVLEAEHKKNAIYKVLSQSRITPKQMFFNVPIEDVRTLFDLMDGDYWEGSPVDIPANDTQIDCMLEKKKVEIKGMFFGSNIFLSMRMVSKPLNSIIREISLEVNQF